VVHLIGALEPVRPAQRSMVSGMSASKRSRLWDLVHHKIVRYAM